jgi:phosphate-selective porin OprO/OprP
LKRTYWKRVSHWAAGVVAALGLAQTSFAQESVESQLQRQQQQIDALRQQTEALLKQNQQLMSQTPPSTGGATVGFQGDIAPAQATGAPHAMPGSGTAAKKDGGYYEVGTDVKLSASWKDGLYLTTENKDFYTHIGGWVQYDNFWWTQTQALRTIPGSVPKGAAQPPTGGIGPLTDGDYWRRLRLQAEGGFWEVFDYNLVFALENNQFDTVGQDEFWMGINKLPLIGSVRAGHVKIAQGLEGDAYSSSKCMTFLERAPYSEAFNQNFGTGLWLFNSYADDRLFYGANLYRQDSTFASGTNFGDGEYAYALRLAALPYVTDDGRCLVHVGASYSWRKAQTAIDTTTVASASSGISIPSIGIPTGIHGVRLRARGGERDADPAGVIRDASSGNSLASNVTRYVDTGTLTANSSDVWGTEFLAIWGPLSLQAEYEWCTVNGVTAPVAAGDYTFSGGYVQLSYFLTGENRAYDRKLGRLDSFYLGRKGPNTPAYFVRGENGGLDWGWGAWELAARYSYLDLNDKAVHGGKEEGWEAGVHWYLTSNLKVQFDYVWNNRYALPAGVIPGSANAFVTRIQLVY